MGYAEEFYLVRHGAYSNDFDGGLTITGREVHAAYARDVLLSKGLGGDTVLLSSDARRTAETAEIIGAGLGIEPIMSATINHAGNYASTVSDLDAVVAQALEDAGVTVENSQGLIVVTHAPMLAIAKDVRTRDVGYGEIYAYQRGSWNNPDAPK